MSTHLGAQGCPIKGWMSAGEVAGHTASGSYMTECHDTWRPSLRCGQFRPRHVQAQSSARPFPLLTFIIVNEGAMTARRGMLLFPISKATGILLRPKSQGPVGRDSVLWAREDGAKEEEQGSGKPIPRYLSPNHVRPYLHGDGCLLGHSLVHADEGHIVVQVIDRALQRGSRCRGLGRVPSRQQPCHHWWSVLKQGTYQDILDRDDRAGEGLVRGHLDNH